MTSKHRRDRETEQDPRIKRQRRRKRSRSEPGLLHDPVNAEKREVLKRLFGRNCSSGFEGVTISSGSSATTGPTGATEAAGFTETRGPSEPIGASEPQEGSDTSPNSDDSQSSDKFGDENADPLLDTVPVNLDPEQLGFLVCAQETLRFLNGRGFPVQHPVFTNLRSRLLRGMDEMAVA